MRTFLDAVIGFDNESATISEDGATSTTVSLQLLTDIDDLSDQYAIGFLDITVEVLASSQATFGKFFQ